MTALVSRHLWLVVSRRVVLRKLSNSRFIDQALSFLFYIENQAYFVSISNHFYIKQNRNRESGFNSPCCHGVSTMQTKSTTKSDSNSIFDLPRIRVKPFLLFPWAKPPEKITRQGSLKKQKKLEI